MGASNMCWGKLTCGAASEKHNHSRYRFSLLLSCHSLIAHTHRVNALAYDAEMSILYLGGSFHSVGNVTITSGLAMWSKRTGLIDFPGGGVQHSDGGVSNTQVKAVAYEPKSEVYFLPVCYLST
jgi:hypothetical protein